MVANTWYKAVGYTKNGTGTCYFGVFDGGTGLMPMAFGGAAWAGTVDAIRTITTDVRVYLDVDGAVGTNGYFDEVSLKPYTLSELIAVRNYGGQVAISAPLTFTSRLSCGVVSRYSDANNFIVARHNGTNARLETCIAGSWTILINTAAAYAAGGVIEIRWAAANTAQLWYRGSQIGTNKDVSAVPAGTWAGLFGTDSTCQIGYPTIT